MSSSLPYSWTTSTSQDPLWWPSPQPVKRQTSTSSYYYAHCAVGGVLASSIRWVTNPLEVIKGYKQIGYYDNKQGILGSLSQLYKTEGLRRGLLKGFVPTAMAYGIQTSTKFTLYEFLKDRLSLYHSHQQLIYVMSAAFAEFVACILMCPFETRRVRTQTATTGTTATTNRTQLFSFRALGPLWCRQIPGTVVNFYAFENINNAMYQHLLTKPKESCSKRQQLAVTITSGYLAGIMVGIVSHPADTLVSLMGQPLHKKKSIRRIVRDTGGFLSLTKKGLAPRILTTGTVIGVQWTIYDAFKTAAMGTGAKGTATGGHYGGRG